jgi:hypothetical protein
VLHLRQPVVRQIFEVGHLRKARIGGRDAKDLFIYLVFILNEEDTDRPNVNAAAGESGLFHEDEHVKRIAVGGERAGNEPVVAGIMHRGKEDAIQTDESRGRVVLILVPAAARDFYDRVHRDIVIEHRGSFLSRRKLPWQGSRSGFLA